MQYLNARQNVISQNIANSDTPNYKPKDLKPVDFGAVLDNVTKKNNAGNVGSVHMVATSAGHLGGAENTERSKARAQRETYEVAPEGNAVIVEEQLLKAGETVMNYTMMSNLYQKQIGMLRTALGQTGR